MPIHEEIRKYSSDGRKTSSGEEYLHRPNGAVRFDRLKRRRLNCEANFAP